MTIDLDSLLRRGPMLHARARALALVSMVGLAVAASGCKSITQGGSGLPQPKITATPDLVGFTSALDGSGSTDPAGRTLSFGWRFESVPQGSKVTNASLSAASAAQTTFEPDLGGTYTVTLRVQAGDDVNEVTKDVVVPTWPVYFSDGNITTSGTTQSFNLVRSDGTGARPLSCVYTVDMGSSGAGEGGALQAVAISGFGSLATYETGDDPLIAFPQFTFVSDAMGRFRVPFQMFVGSSRSDCMTRPASRVDTLAPAVLGAGNTSFYLFTRFSPNGRRISFLAIPQGSGKPSLVTVGIDGKDMRVVTDQATMIPPTWIDDNTIAYGVQAGASSAGYIFKKATDVQNGGMSATTVHDCSGASPPFAEIGQFEVHGNTVFLAARADNAAPITIHKNTLGTCAAAPFVTTEAGAVALDFSVSPDGKTMLFSSSTGYAPLDLGGSFVNRVTDIWSVPVDGSAPPKKLGGDPALIDFGARFIANGRQIIWTQFAPLRETDMGRGGSYEPSTTSLWIANADGSKARKLYGPDAAVGPGAYRLIVGGARSGTFSCDIGGGEVTMVGVALLLALVVLLAARRSTRAR